MLGRLPGDQVALLPSHDTPDGIGIAAKYSSTVMLGVCP